MKILVIEDDSHLSDLICEALREEGNQAEAALDGEDGYYRACTEIYDLMIMDILMPGMDGISLLKKLRQEGIQIPILMLTAKAEMDDKLSALDLGADDYMTKPFEMRELLTRIRVILRRGKSLEIEETRFLDIYLDPQKYTLSNQHNHQEIELGNKEYQLMEYLIHNGGHVLSKEMISDKIWGYENDVEYNNVEVYISFLRKKLQFLQSRAKIKTLRGIGYCLSEDEL